MVASQWLVKTNEVPEVVEKKKVKVAVFGASGRTGGLLVERCLAAEYVVSALVRTPKKFAFWGLTNVVEGSVFDVAAVRRTMAGADVVLSALGARSLRKQDYLARMAKNLYPQM